MDNFKNTTKKTPEEIIAFQTYIYKYILLSPPGHGALKWYGVSKELT